ncbi:unnamed protein product [Bursaphelenchus xylophilus]|uniref:(pine wood nematode) hypothetical protein n=1 Tax=Bursaphelenchus xylophilus TaxID=6326 RepID=A0A1I7RQQ8_BURXY|nr:unnamed protein product [Bursaphelenchus xylophilus]CAG9104967.1 unnamed protein product [Bursaphelenchus xylophilus]
MIKIGVICGLLFVALPVGAEWHLSGRIVVPFLDNFLGYEKVRVQLISGGLYYTLCAEDITDENGYFDITCSVANIFGIKHLAVLHRFEGHQCKQNFFEDISLGDDKVFKLTKDTEDGLDDDQCPKDVYY